MFKKTIHTLIAIFVVMFIIGELSDQKIIDVIFFLVPGFILVLLPIIVIIVTFYKRSR